MTEAELKRRLLTEPVPDELEAQRRAWALVRADFERREPTPWVRRRARPLLALAAAVALLAAAVTPPGRGLAERLREAIAPPPPEPLTLPAPGRVLVVSDDGPWVVQKDGSKRLLGAYEDAVWSPRGLFVAATRDRTLVALEPNGRVRWTISRRAPLSQPRWSPSGFRITYRSGQTLRLVAGDGAPDHLLARSPGAAASAWRPGVEHFVAFTDRRNRVRIVNTDAGRAVFSRKRIAAPVQQLAWSADGDRLLALTTRGRHPVFDAAAKRVSVIEQPRGHRALAAAFAPNGRALVYIDYDPGRNVSSVIYAARPDERRTLFSGAGRFDGLAWSPSGRWLLVGWPDADQWVFVDVPRVRRVETASAVTREFDPGGSGDGRFPRIVGWSVPAAG